MSRFARFICLTATGLFTSYLNADIMIGMPTTHVGSIALTGCTGYAGTSTLVPDPITHLGAAAATGLLDKTFMADVKAQFPGWTLNFAGATLNGTLNIANYSATNLGNCIGGAALDATYAPAKTDPSGLTFMQVFSYAVDRKGTHIDPFPNDDDQPFYYTTAERAKYGLNFVDNPQVGPLPHDYSNTVTFSNYLVTFNLATKTATAYDGFSWGYMVMTTSPTPEPSSVLLTLMALAGLGMLRSKRPKVRR